jgi:signal transduction histidine kinase
MRSQLPTLSFAPVSPREGEAPPSGQRWRHFLRPPREAESRAHQLEISWQNSLGMTILGLVGLLYAIARCLAYGLSSEAQSGFGAGVGHFSIGMGIAGFLALLGSRWTVGRRFARPAVGLLLVALSGLIGLASGLTPLSLGMPTVSGPAPLLLLLTVGLMAFRPLQILLLSIGVTLATVGAALLAGAPQTMLVSISLEVALLSLAALVFGALLYQLRWGIIERRLQLLEQRDYLRTRTKSLEDDNERLRAQRSHVLDVAESSKLQSLSGLAAGLAHEINNPMGSVYANVDVMERAVRNLRQRFDSGECPTLTDDRKVKRSLEVLDRTLPITREAMARVTAVVDSLESFARLDRAPRVPVDLREGMDGALSLLSFRLGETIEVQRDYGSELPKVVADGERLHQVFMNLLCNAVQAIDGSGRITVSIAEDPPGEEVRIRVSDTGAGIPKEALPRIFEPGFTTRGVGVGTGLGLAIAYRIVEAHGGTIEVDSEVGEGTSVTLRLPVQRADDDAFKRHVAG